MAHDVLELLATRLPELFAGAVAALERRAESGDLDAREKLAALTGQAVGARLQILGRNGQELLACVEGRGLRFLQSEPAPVFGHAVALDASVWAHGLALAEQRAGAAEEVIAGLCVLGSRAACEIFSNVTYFFELTVTRVPVLGDVKARIALGRCTLAGPAEFALTVDYDELEDAREQGLGPHQLFLAGKVRIDGDVAKAMMLGMTLAQLS